MFHKFIKAVFCSVLVAGIAPYCEAQTIVASPNPIFISNSTTVGQTTLYVSGPSGHAYSIYVGGPPPSGKLFASGGSQFAATTGNWVSNGGIFYLVDQATKATVGSVVVHTISVPLPSNTLGCSFGPYTSCLDPVPATYVAGSWIEDDGSSEWTLTGGYSALPGSTGTVSGNVLVFANPSGSCPIPKYQVSSSSSYSPSAITTTEEGYTQFTWVATNPNPSTSCGGYTPVSSNTFEGSIINKGNDTASGTYTNSSGLSGPITLETNLIFTPTGETVTASGFGSPGSNAYTLLQFDQTLSDSHSYDGPDPYSNRFQGRQVYEAAGTSTPVDGCYQAAVNDGLTPPVPKFAVQGSVWNVGASGSGNHYGQDGVGFSVSAVNWYRQNLQPNQLPCTATASQAMFIEVNIPGSSDTNFATHTLSVKISASSVTDSKDGISSTLNY